MLAMASICLSGIFDRMCDVVLECCSCFQFWRVRCSHCERMSGSNVRESDKTGAGIIGDRPNHSPGTTQYAVKPKTGLQAREEQTLYKPRKVSRKNGLRGCPALAAVVNGKKGEAGSCWKSCCWIALCAVVSPGPRSDWLIRLRGRVASGSCSSALLPPPPPPPPPCRPPPSAFPVSRARISATSSPTHVTKVGAESTLLVNLGPFNPLLACKSEERTETLKRKKRKGATLVGPQPRWQCP